MIVYLKVIYNLLHDTLPLLRELFLILRRRSTAYRSAILM